MKIGVIGAGSWAGVAQNLAQSGHNVILIDISDEILEQAKMELYTNIRFSGFYNKDAGAEDPDTVLSRVEFTTHYESLGDADFIIENVPEQWQIKKKFTSGLNSTVGILHLFGEYILHFNHQSGCCHQKAEQGDRSTFYESSAVKACSGSDSRLPHLGENDSGDPRVAAHYG